MSAPICPRRFDRSRFSDFFGCESTLQELPTPTTATAQTPSPFVPWLSFLCKPHSLLFLLNFPPRFPWFRSVQSFSSSSPHTVDFWTPHLLAAVNNTFAARVTFLLGSIVRSRPEFRSVLGPFRFRSVPFLIPFRSDPVPILIPFRFVQVLAAVKNARCPDCIAVSLSTGHRAHAPGVLGGEYFVADRISNMGYAFNRTVWRTIKAQARTFCGFDDYGWDWTLECAVMASWEPEILSLHAAGKKRRAVSSSKHGGCFKIGVCSTS